MKLLLPGGCSAGAVVPILLEGTLLVASSAKRFIAATGNGAFALADLSGRVLSQGRLSESVSASMVVIADYGLLHDLDLTQFSTTGEVGLLFPDRRQSAVSIARQWSRTTVKERVYLRLLTDGSELDHLIRARAEIVADQNLMLRRVHDRLSAVSSEYADVLSDSGELILQVLPILRDHPTPHHLQAAAIVQLSHAVRASLPAGRQNMIDRLFALHDFNCDGNERLPAEHEVAEVMIPGDIDSYLQLEQHLMVVDQRIYQRVARASQSTLTRTSQMQFSVLRQPVVAPRSEGAPRDPHSLLREANELLKKRSTSGRRALSDYEEFLRLQSSLERFEDALTPAVLVRMETFGQLLALSAGRFLSAIRHRTTCEAQFSAIHTPQEDLPLELANVLSDAALAMAITEMCAIDIATGFPTLRNGIESKLAAHATPEILSEAFGLFTMANILFGERTTRSHIFTSMKEAIVRIAGAGPARAMHDISEFFLHAGRPDSPRDLIESLRATADEHSSDTPYRAYFNYTVMLSSFLTGEPEVGLSAYDSIVIEGLWPGFNGRMYRLARLNHAVLLAGQGNFGLARRELASIQHTAIHSSDGADGLIREFMDIRLDLATGKYRNVLNRTNPDGPLGEEQIAAVQLRRFVPLLLLLRGSALWHEGAIDRAIECFHRATLQACIDEEWYVILAGQTLEYQHWLSTLDRTHPTAKLTPELLTALLERRPFVSHSLIPLTPQQERVLPLLAQGRSISSIATELHVSTNTMKTHLRALYKKLAVNSRDLAVLQAEAYGLFDVPASLWKNEVDA